MVAEVQPRANTTVLSVLYVLSFVFLFGESLQPNGREERERQTKYIRGGGHNNGFIGVDM